MYQRLINMLLKNYFLKGVFNGAGQILKQNGLLMTYGVCIKKFIIQFKKQSLIIILCSVLAYW